MFYIYKLIPAMQNRALGHGIVDLGFNFAKAANIYQWSDGRAIFKRVSEFQILHFCNENRNKLSFDFLVYVDIISRNTRLKFPVKILV